MYKYNTINNASNIPSKEDRPLYVHKLYVYTFLPSMPQNDLYWGDHV